MKIKIILLLISVFITSCSSNSGLEFPVTENSYTRMVVPDLPLRLPGNLIATDSLLIVVDPFSDDYSIKAYDKYSGNYLFSGAKVGNGPLEVSTPFNLHINRDIHLFDVAKQKIVCYVVNPQKTGILAVSEHYLPASDFYSNATYLDGEGFLVYPSKEDGVISFIDLANTKEFTIVDNPLKKVDDKIVKNELAGSFKMDDSGKYLVFSAIFTPYVSLYENKDGLYEMVFDKFISEPAFLVSGEDFKWNEEENVKGFTDVAIGNNRIFLLHSNLKMGVAKGRSIEVIPRIMYEFDYQGNPLKRHNLDTPLLRLFMDSDGSLYGISMDEEQHTYNIVQVLIED